MRFTLRGARTPLFAVLATAFAARLVSLLALKGDLSIRVPLLDGLHYMTTAIGLAHGQGWPPGPHFMAPIYPFLLSGLFRIAPASVVTVQAFQLVLGVLTAGLIYQIGRRMGAAAGLTAGLLYALCGPAIAYENQVLMEALLAFCIAGVLWIEDEPARGPLRGLAAGIAIGIATAGRPTYVFLLPLLFVGGGNGRRTIVWRNRFLLAGLLGFAVVVAPPSIHNMREMGRPSFVTTSGGLNLYIGNHPGASGIYSQPPGLFLEKDPTGTRSASQMAGRSLTPAEASDFYAARAVDFVKERPGAAIRLVFKKLGYLLSPAEIPQIESMDDLRRDHLSMRLLGLIGFPVLFPLALLGAVANRAGTRTRRSCILALAAGALAHLIFFSTGRYRASMLPAFAILAGAGGEVLIALLKSRRGWGRIWPIPVAVVVLLIAPRVDRSAARAWSLHQTGIRYEKIGADRAAEEVYRRALEADSTLGESWHNLAACEARLGRQSEAIQTYERALRYLGENPVTLYNLAVIYGGLGLDDRALTYFNRSVLADPADSAVRVDRGVALYRLGRVDEAFEDWRQVASQSPQEPSLARTLTRLAQLGVALPPDLARHVHN
jgi:tetratricopeptide (TPR) repeat protein